MEMKAGVKAASDAAIRRAQNEATFLRTQLNSEVKCKQDLESALKAVNEKLVALQSEHKKQVEQLEEAARSAKADGEAKAASMQQVRISLEGEVMRLTQTSSDATQTAERLKNELREAQAALETKAAAVARLEERAVTAEKAALGAKVTAGQASIRHKQSLQAAQNTVAEVSRAKDVEIASLQRDLAAKVAKLAETQRRLLDTSDETSAVRNEESRLHGAARLSRALQAWKQRRQASALATWRVNMVVERERTEAARDLDTQLLEARTQAQAEKDKACNMLLREFRANKKAGLARLEKVEAVRLSLLLLGLF